MFKKLFGLDKINIPLMENQIEKIGEDLTSISEQNNFLNLFKKCIMDYMKIRKFKISDFQITFVEQNDNKIINNIEYLQFSIYSCVSHKFFNDKFITGLSGYCIKIFDKKIFINVIKDNLWKVDKNINQLSK